VEYPDTEKEVGLAARLSGSAAAVIHYQFNNVETIDDQLLTLLCVVDRFGSSNTRLVLPYLPYGRSSVFSDSAAVDKLRFIVKELAGRVRTMYLVGNIERLRRAQGRFKNVRLVNVDEELIRLISGLGRDIFLVSPDRGFAKTVQRLARRMGVEYVALVKRRLGPATVAISATVTVKKLLRVNKGAQFVIVDDIVSTGDTLAKAARVLRSQGVRKVSYVALHDTRRKNGNRQICVHCSNSLQTAAHAFDLTSSIVKALNAETE
jgi:ribose-phosphate pyrophosphokinase